MGTWWWTNGWMDLGVAYFPRSPSRPPSRHHGAAWGSLVVIFWSRYWKFPESIESVVEPVSGKMGLVYSWCFFLSLWLLLWKHCWVEKTALLLLRDFVKVTRRLWAWWNDVIQGGWLLKACGLTKLITWLLMLLLDLCPCWFSCLGISKISDSPMWLVLCQVWLGQTCYACDISYICFTLLLNPMSHSLVVFCNPFDMVKENNVVFSFLVRSDASFGSIGFVFPREHVYWWFHVLVP